MAARAPTSSGAATATTGCPAAPDIDRLFGGAGDDQLDGGADADAMYGWAGNDTYYVNSSGDVVQEEVGAGIDTVWCTVAITSLAANVEHLHFNGVGSFTGIGNEYRQHHHRQRPAPTGWTAAAATTC